MRRAVLILVTLGLIAGGYYVYQSSEGDTQTASEQDGQRPAGGRPGGRGGGRATSVVTVVAEKTPYVREFRSNGETQAIENTDVVSDASGLIAKSNVAANIAVQAGEVLLELDSRTEEVALISAKAEYNQALTDFNRAETLVSSNSISRSQHEEASTALALAGAKLELAQEALDRRQITAPISGAMGLDIFSVGDRINAGDKITTIDNRAQLFIEFELPERAVGLLGNDATVSLSTPTYAGQVFDAKITGFDSRIDSITRSITVRALVDNAGDKLWPGMTFAVRLAYPTETKLSVPSTAIIWTSAGANIWIVNDGKAEAVPVTIVNRSGEQVWIDSDIAEGTQIVSEGAHKLRPGSAVKVVGDEGGERPQGDRDNG